MKTQKIVWLAVVLFAGCFWFLVSAQDRSGMAAYEYVTIRWDGRDNTHLIRTGGKVEFIGMELRKLQRPDRADERSFYMNAAVNGLAKEGYEVAAMTPDEILMKRTR